MNPDDRYSDFFLDYFNMVDFVNNDECDATIYWRFDYEADWQVYDGSRLFGYNSTVEAYAVAEGKLPSEIVSATLSYYEEYLYSTRVIDGIHYYYQDSGMNSNPWSNPNFEAYVCSRKESQIYSPSFTGEVVVPSEIDIHGSTYTVKGIRNAAFASTFNYPSEITSVELPSTIQEIEPSAFAGCTQLTSMMLHAVTPPYTGDLFEYEYGDEDSHYYDYVGFDSNQLYNQVTLYVPYEALDDYRTHEEWGRFSHIVSFIGAGPGDVDGDGILSINDVMTIIDQLLVGDNAPAYCDIDGDGSVSISDIVALIDMVLNAG